MSFKEKYFKYKLKYLNLKKNLHGGALIDAAQTHGGPILVSGLPREDLANLCKANKQLHTMCNKKIEIEIQNLPAENNIEIDILLYDSIISKLHQHIEYTIHEIIMFGERPADVNIDTLFSKYILSSSTDKTKVIITVYPKKLTNDNIRNVIPSYNDEATKNQYGPIEDWNTHFITDMSHMFQLVAPNFNENIGNWDTSSVTDMYGMFASATIFNQNISMWNTSAVTNMRNMFGYAVSFNNGGEPLTWNTSNVTNMSAMFSGAEAFNQDISMWNTSAVIDMSAMFARAKAFNQDISIWNTSSVTDMRDMFRHAESFNNGGEPLRWDTSSVTDMSFMFSHAKAFNQDINTKYLDNDGTYTWDTGAVTNMSFMFSGAEAFNQDISMWNTSNVTNMSAMFSGTEAFNQDISMWNTSAVIDMNAMFARAKAFNNGGEPLTWDMRSVENRNNMFINSAFEHYAL